MSTLFQKAKIGTLTAANCFVRSATAEGLADKRKRTRQSGESAAVPRHGALDGRRETVGNHRRKNQCLNPLN